MNAKKAVVFEQAFDIAIEKAKSVAAEISNELTLVRDLRGRIRIMLPGGRTNLSGEKKTRLGALAQELSESLGNYGFTADRMFLFANDLLQGEDITNSPERLLLGGVEGCKVWLLDRQITGQDWLRGTLPRKTNNLRATFFGIKGGVGRSTALVIWGWHLARQGKKVLIFDLDLESPGVSSTLLPADYMPDFGIVDWFVEDGVGQAEVVEREMVTASPLTKGLVGDIRIVPAFGTKTGDYLPKLARCYADAPGNEPSSWSIRLGRLVSRFEALEMPDITLLDSRAGIHDIAAAAVTRMGAQSFLFAVDSPQTWKAYGFLFNHWKQHPQLASIREHLQIVDAMIPETGREEHLKRFRLHSWDVFRDHLYDEALPNNPDAFNFDLNDQSAPHYPWPIFWHRGLQEFDPIGSRDGLDEKMAAEAMGSFMDAAETLLTSAGKDELA